MWLGGHWEGEQKETWGHFWCQSMWFIWFWDILRYFDEVLVWVLNCILKGIGTEPSYFTIERFYLGDIWDICIKVWSQYVSIFLVEVLVQALSVSPKGSEKQLPAETVGRCRYSFPINWWKLGEIPQFPVASVLTKALCRACTTQILTWPALGSHVAQSLTHCLRSSVRTNIFKHYQYISIPMYQRSYFWSFWFLSLFSNVFCFFLPWYTKWFSDRAGCWARIEVSSPVRQTARDTVPASRAASCQPTVDGMMIG